MTFTSALDELDRMHGRLAGSSQDLKWRLIGSSMGSYLAARWAQLHPERVDRLILLSPAFDFAKVIARIAGDGALQKWQEQGSWLCPGPDGKLTKLHSSFLKDISRHPAEPLVHCPALILHGINDE